MQVLIDAYNVMRSTGFADDYDLKILKNQRGKFLELLSSYAERSKNTYVAVFDGAGSGELLSGRECCGKVDIRYSAGGETADDLIKRMVADAKAPGNIMVVTSDKEIAFYVKQCGAHVVNAKELYLRIRIKSSVENTLNNAEYFEKYIKGYDAEPVSRGSGYRNKKRRANL